MILILILCSGLERIVWLHLALQGQMLPGNQVYKQQAGHFYPPVLVRD